MQSFSQHYYRKILDFQYMTAPTYVINAIQNGKNSELELEGGKARQVGIVEDLKCPVIRNCKSFELEVEQGNGKLKWSRI